MTFIEKLEQIERVDALIRRKGTGSPRSLAEKLSVSERYIYNLINLMKDMGAPVYFCNSQNSYCYSEAVKFSLGFLPDRRDYEKIVGGKSNYFSSLHDRCSNRIYI